MKIKSSLYNFLVDKRYLYNALTGNVVQILPEYEEIVKKLCIDRKNPIETLILRQ